jgi:segregation and condensation protein B
MLNDEILKALIEGIIYIAPEPVTLDGILKTLEGEDRERVKAKLDELVADYEQNVHGIQVRQVANGYKFSTKAEHHEILRKYVKSLKPAIRLSKPALETLAVIAYRQPVTMPEIEEIRGVDSGGVIHTLLEKKLVVTSGRKAVVGRPILYRTSKDFLVHFGLKDVGELPSLKEFEELAKRALGSEWAEGEAPAATGEAAASPNAEGSTVAVEGAAETSEQSLPPATGEAVPLDAVVAVEPVPAAAEKSSTENVEHPPVVDETVPGETPVAVEPVPAAAEESSTENGELPPVVEEMVPSEVPETVETTPGGAEEPSTENIELPPVVDETVPAETPVAVEPVPAAAEESSTENVELPPVAEEIVPTAVPVETGPVPALPEEAGTVNLDEHPAPPEETVPPVDAESIPQEDTGTTAQETHSSDEELPAESADNSTPAITEPTSATDSLAAPEDHEPKA